VKYSSEVTHVMAKLNLQQPLYYYTNMYITIIFEKFDAFLLNKYIRCSPSWVNLMLRQELKQSEQ